MVVFSPVHAHPPTTKFEADPPGSRTFARQHELPRLPIPSLEDTCRRYLTALEGLQDAKEHERTRRAVEEFLHHDGQKWQEQLKGYAEDKARCVAVERSLYIQVADGDTVTGQLY